MLTLDRDAGTSERVARRRFASQLERFVAEDYRSALQDPTVVVRLELDADSESGPDYGPPSAPEHLHRTLGELIDLALDDLSLRP
jgi:hypothetical protein